MPGNEAWISPKIPGFDMLENRSQEVSWENLKTDGFGNCRFAREKLNEATLNVYSL